MFVDILSCHKRVESYCPPLGRGYNSAKHSIVHSTALSSYLRTNDHNQEVNRTRPRTLDYSHVQINKIIMLMKTNRVPNFVTFVSIKWDKHFGVMQNWAKLTS